MNTEELTNIANVHQSVLTRHDQEISGVRTLINITASQHRDDFGEINNILKRVAQQQESNTQAITQLQQTITQLAAESQLSRQDITQLTANIESLRHQVADWMSSRSQ